MIAVWMPNRERPIAPRQVIMVFFDVTGAEYVRWCYPGFPNTGHAVKVSTWNRWVRNSNARELRA